MSAVAGSLQAGRAEHRPDRGSLPSRHELASTSTSTRLRGGRAAAVGNGVLTLDESIVGVWEGLHGGHPAACPVCGGTMVSSPAAGSRPVAARCSSCHAQLS